MSRVHSLIGPSTLFAVIASSVMMMGCGGEATGGTGGHPGAGGAGGSGGSGSGGEGGSISGELDPFVDVPPQGPYGEHTIKVPAATNWVNTGLYLHAGETVTFTAQGSWSMDGATFVGPKGLMMPIERGCPRNGLVARLGLLYDDMELFCVGDGGTMTASRDGIVYLAANYDTDLGETYGTRLDAKGAVDVTISSTGDTVPTIGKADVATYDFSKVQSGWVELRGVRTIVTVPAADALADKATAKGSIETLDSIYDIESELRSAVPYLGQRIRFFPDPNIDALGAYMLAGNPIRAVPDIMSGMPDQRILRASEAPTDVWGFSHEFGHTFTLANGTWTYMIVNIESWPNVFTLRALEALNRTHPNKDSYCDNKAAYLASGTYQEVRDDPFLQLCFLMEFQTTYGWDFWSKFYVAMNGTTNNDIPYDPMSDAPTWGFVRDRFNDAAGEDTTDVFITWRIPLPAPTPAPPAAKALPKLPLPLD